MHTRSWLLCLLAGALALTSCASSTNLTDPCASNPCAATGKTCTASDTVAVCACPAGYLDQGNGCVRASACAVNPCSGAHKTVCFEADAGATCLCNPGYEANGATCTAIAGGGGGDCASHAVAGDDAFEPDDCASSSRLYADAQARTLTAGDADWIHATAAANHIVQISVSGAAYPIVLDVFGADGSTALAADHSGSASPQVGFVSPGGLYYVRVKAPVASDSGSYALTITDSGADDFPGTVGAATALVGNTFAGSLQFPGDEDVARLSVTAGHSYRFTLAATTADGVAVEVDDLDGVTLRKTLDRTIPANGTHLARAHFDGSYLLHAKALSPGQVGAFSVSLVDLGADDRGDVVQDADVIAPAATFTTGTFERSDDLDSFKFNAVAGHAYRFTCTGGGYGCVMSMLDSGGVVVAQQSATYSSTTTLNATAAGPGTWSVTVAPSGSISTGSYSYKLEDLGGDDYSNSYQTPYVISAGANVNGTIEVANDHDVFGVATAAGHVYVVSCNSPAFSSCPITVRDPQAAVIASTPSGTDSTIRFRSATAGQYTFDLTSATPGQYTLTVTDGGPDDSGNDTLAQAVPMNASGATTGAIGYQGDVDFYSFPTTAGHIYQVACTPLSSGCALTLYDPSDSQLTTSTYWQQLVGVLSASGGSYKVKVSGYSATQAPGSYSLSLTDLGSDDHANVVAGATALTLGAGVGGNLQYAGDSDVFTFSGTAQHIYGVTCAPSGISTAAGTYVCGLAVADSSAVTVASNNGTSSGPSLTAFKASGTQTYSIAVTGYPYAGPYYGPFQITVVDRGTDDYGDTVATATAISVGTPYDGNSDYGGDKDVFTFSTVANHIYKVVCTTSTSGLCNVTVRDSSATSVSTGNPSAPAEFYSATAANLSVEIASSAGAAPGTYSFQVVDEGPDDYGNTVATAALITPGTINGNNQYVGDHDVFSFNTTAGKIYAFTLTTSTSVQMQARDATGASVGTTTTGGSIVFKATTSGVYSLDVWYYGGFFGGAGKAGAFSFTYAEITDDYGDSAAAASPITLATTVNGNLEYSGDTDWFAVTLSSGTAYTLTSSGASVYMNMYAANGTTQVLSASYRTGTYTPSTSGTFYVRVFYASGTGAYTLRVE